MLPLALVLAFTLLFAPVAQRPSPCGSGGTTTQLQLVVTNCEDTTQTLPGALVQVQHRQCGVTLAIYSGVTDSVGYVAFSIPHTQAADTCLVVTDPPTFDPVDRVHRYVYPQSSPLDRPPGGWDLGEALTVGCVDVYRNVAGTIIECRYGPPPPP